MSPTSARARAWFWLLAALAVFTGLISFRFLSFDARALGEELRANLIDHPVPFYVHTTLAPIALIVGIWQFLPRTRRGSYHRRAGRVYVASSLIAALAGFTVALTTEAGMVAGTSFVILAALWFGATITGYLRARAGDYTSHRRWMMRSYALTCAAITLRIILPVGLASGLTFQSAYVIAAWGCWPINLMVVQLMIRRMDRTGAMELLPA